MSGYLAGDDVVLEKGRRVDPDNTLCICVVSGLAEDLVLIQNGILDRREPVLLAGSDLEPFNLVHVLFRVEETTSDEGSARCRSNNVREGEDVRSRDLICS